MPSRTPQLNPARRAPRGFTLLELMLATLLGAMVVSTCLALFAAVDRGNRRNETRFERTMEISRTQRAASNAIHSFLMSPSTQLIPGAPSAANARPPQPGATDAEGETPQDTRAPRVLLDIDTSAGGSMYHRTVDGGIELLPPQRFELVLQSPPVIAEPGAPETMEYLALLAAAQEPRSAAPSATDQEPVNPDEQPTVAPGVRGAFELRWEPDPGAAGAGGPETPLSALQGSGGWSLWWRPLRNETTDDAESTTQLPDTPEPQDQLAEVPVRLISDLVCCQWGAVRRGEVLSGFSAVQFEDLPAYVTLEIETRQGQWHKWMFEVGWRTGPEPGTILEAPAAPVDSTREAERTDESLTTSPDRATRKRESLDRNGAGSRPGEPADDVRMKGKPR
jgi:prepilin-type N-terminal cleavage/methylation domain-containing protein